MTSCLRLSVTIPSSRRSCQNNPSSLTDSHPGRPHQSPNNALATHVSLNRGHLAAFLDLSASPRSLTRVFLAASFFSPKALGISGLGQRSVRLILTAQADPLTSHCVLCSSPLHALTTPPVSLPGLSILTRVQPWPWLVTSTDNRQKLAAGPWKFSTHPRQLQSHRIRFPAAGSCLADTDKSIYDLPPLEIDNSAPRSLPSLVETSNSCRTTRFVSLTRAHCGCGRTSATVSPSMQITLSVLSTVHRRFLSVPIR